MVRLKGHLYLHLERERGHFNAVVLRVRVWDWFQLGATDVVEAPHEDMKKSYTSFASAAAAVHKALYRNADTAPENVYWNDYVAYIRHSLPQSSDSNRADNPADDGPFNRSRRRGTLSCRFYVEGIVSFTSASPELASLMIDSLPSSDGAGEWVRAGQLRPFVPAGVELAEIDPLVRRQIRFDQHHMRRSNSLNAVRKRSRHDREQEEEEEGQVPEVELYGDGRQGRGKHFVAGGARAAGVCDVGAYSSVRDAGKRRADAEHESFSRGARSSPGDEAPDTDLWTSHLHRPNDWDNYLSGSGDARAAASLSPREALGLSLHGAPDGHDERRRPAAGVCAHAFEAPTGVSGPRRGPAPGSEAAREAKRRRVRTLEVGDLVFVDWPRLPDIVSPATPAGLPAFIVSWEIVRMDVPSAAGESSPFDVRVAPWSRDGLAADPATHIVVPRNHLINFHAGFRPAWAAGGARAPHESLLDAIEYKVEFRRRRKPAYPGAEKMWREVMGEAPLPARFGGAGRVHIL